VVFGIFDDLATRGKTIVMVTHDDALAERATRLIRIADGLIVADNGNRNGGNRNRGNRNRGNRNRGNRSNRGGRLEDEVMRAPAPVLVDVHA
jgi:energy-coupling factor transporter ATP-binding protein EcfA2